MYLEKSVYCNNSSLFHTNNHVVKITKTCKRPVHASQEIQKTLIQENINARDSNCSMIVETTFHEKGNCQGAVVQTISYMNKNYRSSVVKQHYFVFKASKRLENNVNLNIFYNENKTPIIEILNNKYFTK